jgi:hypothetical protein
MQSEENNWPEKYLLNRRNYLFIADRVPCTMETTWSLMEVVIKRAGNGFGFYISPDHGLSFVSGITPNSPAERAGLKVGDRLLSSNLHSLSRILNETSKITRDGFHHQLLIRTLSGFYYLFQQLAYLVFRRMFLTASTIGELLGSYQEYPAKSEGKQEEEFLTDSGNSKKLAGLFIRNLVKLVNLVPEVNQPLLCG